MRTGNIILLGVTLAIASPAFAQPVFFEQKSTSIEPEFVTVIHEIRGADTRQNPVIKKLATPFEGDTLFVRFQIRYAAATIDNPPDDEGEFFVLWLDASRGGETSSHSNGVPNIGIHVKEGKANHFMARFSSGTETFGPALQGDRDFTLVGKIWKSKKGPENAFDNLAIWIDPKSEGKPDATISSANGLVKKVAWLGFSTGAKTEPEDRIQVSRIALATSWEEVMRNEVPEEAAMDLTAIPDPPAYVSPPPPETIAKIDPPPDLEKTDHWAFQLVQRPAVPKPKNTNWVRTPVDAIVARLHEKKGLTAAPVASAETLARRMSLVLTGLPPERNSSATDDDPDTYAEELLASPQYGERWGRHWLDVARWAESNGHQHNRDRLHAWKYRDWVVKSFNADKPFDLFLTQQIAGDEIAPFSSDNLVGTGFLAAARYSGNELDKDIQRNDILTDVVNTTAKAFLGLTMECAQCHDHFFDPLTQWDYYQLMAFFEKGQPGDVILEGDEVDQLIQKRWGLFESVRARLVENKRQQGSPEPVLVIPKSVISGMTRSEKKAFNHLESQIAKFPQSWAWYSPITSPHQLDVAPNPIRWPLPFQREALEEFQVRFLDRGDVGAPGPVATASWPAIFGGQKSKEEKASRSRLDLANWLTAPHHPLTARVWVNRIWQWHFGTGLVATSGDFGTQGTKPSHPDLLDWLASELIESGWSTKHIHRLILKSNTFRQSSLFSASNAERDPGNHAIWRWKPRRLEGEAIRDSALAVAGLLDRTQGGPSIPRGEKSESSRRRSLYLQQRRDNLPHQQMLFDGPNAVTSCARRRTSTVAMQPLWLLNSEFMKTAADALADSVKTEKGASAQAAQLIRTVYFREAEEEEIEQLVALMEDSSLADAAQVVLNANEFVYVP